MPYINEREKTYFHRQLGQLKASISRQQALYDEMNRRMDHPDSLAFEYEDGQMDLVMAGDRVQTVYNEFGYVTDLLPDVNGVVIKFDDGEVRDVPCSRISSLTYESMIAVPAQT